MSEDEAEIRRLIDQWHAATRAGDIPTVLGLMTDDVVFQVPGRPPFGKAEFESMSRASAGASQPRIDAEQHIDELRVLGDFACVRSSLRIVITPPDGAPLVRVGTTLTLFRRESDRWLLARDANLLATVGQ